MAMIDIQNPRDSAEEKEEVVVLSDDELEEVAGGVLKPIQIERYP